MVSEVKIVYIYEIHVPYYMSIMTFFSGSQESRITKAKKQEQYKKELQQQMQEQADIKKRY